jgi:hypothetical protein
MRFASRLFLGFILAASLPLFSVAQETPPAETDSSRMLADPALASGQQNNPEPKAQDGPPAPADQTQSDKKDGAQSTSGQGKPAGDSGTSHDRLFLALPNFLTLENAGNVPPLTTEEKFRVVARGSFDKVQFAWYGFLAGISQAENSEPGFGQGAEGYGKRYASAFADGAIENFMTSAVFPSMLHQDPRFFQSSNGGFTHRTGYAISRIFVTRTDSGHSQFNYSEIAGSAVSAAISTNTYHPRAFITTRYDPATNTLIYVHNASDRTLPNTLSVWGTQVAYDTLTIVIKEFWPDIHRKMVHKHNDADPAPVSAAKP